MAVLLAINSNGAKTTVFAISAKVDNWGRRRAALVVTRNLKQTDSASANSVQQ